MSEQTNAVNKEDDYKIKLSIDPDDFSSLVNLCQLYLDKNDLISAEPYLLKIHNLKPDHPQTTYHLGILSEKLGKIEEACLWLEKTIELYPRHIDALAKLGKIYLQLGQTGLAKTKLDQAIETNPDIPETAEAFNIRGIIYLQENSFDQAIVCFEKAIKLNPKIYFALINLSKVYMIQKDFESAKLVLKRFPDLPELNLYKILDLAKIFYYENNYDQAIEILESNLDNYPNNGLICLRLGEILSKTNKPEQATLIYEKAFKDLTLNIQALIDLGSRSLELSNYNLCINSMDKILKLQPNNVEAYWYLACCCVAQGNNFGAIMNLDIAVSLDPNNFRYYYALGIVYSGDKQPEKSAQSLLTALELSPEDPDVLSAFTSLYKFMNSQILHRTICYNSIRNIIEDYEKDNKNKQNIKYTRGQSLALINYAYSCLRCCDWAAFEKIQPLLEIIVDEQITYSYSAKMSPFIAQFTLDAEKYQLKITNLVCNEFTYPEHKQFKHTNTKTKTKNISNKKLKIGYISADFNEHVIGFIIDGLFSYHNRDQFQINGYYLNNTYDPTHNRIKNTCDNFKYISELTFQEAANLIYNDKIDILVDLAGYTGGAKPNIFGLKPAPIQAHWLGQAGSMGGKFMDYHITTEMLSPKDQLHFYTEQLVYLPNTPIAIKRYDIPKEMPTRQDYNLPKDAIVYCCFNAAYRIDKKTFTSWMKILHNVPNSVLWISIDDEELLKNLQFAANKLNITPDRIIPKNRTKLNIDWHHRLADVYLDTIVVSGGTTGMLSAWANLPVVTIAGNTPQSRYGAGIMHAVGLKEVIAHSYTEYENIAIELGNNPEKLNKIKTLLNKNKQTSILFDQKNFILQLEQTYKLMWEDHVNGHKQRIIKVK